MPDATLPYSREQLPAPLPTIDDILHSRRVLAGDDDHSTRRVVVVNNFFLVKIGQRVDFLEGHNLLFIEQNFPDIPAPRLYAMWKESLDVKVIVMEFVEGDSLQDRWPYLAEEEKRLVLGDLRLAFDCIRKLPSSGFYGSIMKGPLPHPLFYSEIKSDRAISGPFNSGAEVIRGIAQKSRKIWAENGKHSYLADLYEEGFLPALGETEPKFTHADLQRKNIIIKDLSSPTRFRVSIVDWELAGWYPEYWEYVAAFFSFDWDQDDWSIMIKDCIDIRPLQAAAFQIMYRDLLF